MSRRVPPYLEARLAELGGDVAVLGRELVERDGWSPTNVARVLGDAPGGKSSTPSRAKFEEVSHVTAQPEDIRPAARRAPRRARRPSFDSESPPRAIPPPPPSSTRLAPAAAPKARRARLLGPVRAPEPPPPLRPLTPEALGLEHVGDELEVAGYGARVDVEELEREPLPDVPARPKRGGRKPDGAVVLELFEQPRMFPGPGERKDCVHESECLGRAVQIYGGTYRTHDRLTAVHCPTWCKHHEAPTRDALIHLASAGKAQGYNS